MFVELHLIQNFAPSCLNRDDTNTPKDCEFGGYRRARISSQCIKRAVRCNAAFRKVLQEYGAVRTRRLILEIAKGIDANAEPTERTVKIVAEIFNEGGIERPKVKKGEEAEKDNTKLILFLSRKGITQLTELLKEKWESLASGAKDDRRELIAEMGDILVESVKTPDIAMFGRMIEIEASKPFGKRNLGVHAACQVAHAISTNKVDMDMDYFTAVDDLQPDGDPGAGMIGTVEFNSSCFYRYANIDLEQLKHNLRDDGEEKLAEELARKTVEAFIRASVAAIPTGKQNSMAAQNPPSFVFAVVRDGGLWSLANAFVQPVRPCDEGTVTASIKRVDAYWAKLSTGYGETGVVCRPAFVLDEAGTNARNGNTLVHLKDQQVSTLDELVQRVMASLRFAQEAAT